MKNIEIEKIMADVIKETGQEKSVVDKNRSDQSALQDDKSSYTEDIQLDSLELEDLMGLLKNYQTQFIEMLEFKGYDPAFTEIAVLQQELNEKYCILDPKKNLSGMLSRLIRKILGISAVLSRQEQYNAVATKTLNRLIEINTSMTREIFQVRTQLYFLAIQAKIVSRIIQKIEQTAKRLKRDAEHQLRRDEYLGTIVPELHGLRKELIARLQNKNGS